MRPFSWCFTNSLWTVWQHGTAHRTCCNVFWRPNVYKIRCLIMFIDLRSLRPLKNMSYGCRRFKWPCSSYQVQQQEHPKHAAAQGRFKREHRIQKLSVGTNCADFHRLSDPGIYIFFLFRSRQQHRVQFNLNFRITWNWNGSHAMIVHEFKQESDWHALVFVWRPEVQ